jgi:hypothetical protein
MAVRTFPDWMRLPHGCAASAAAEYEQRVAELEANVTESSVEVVYGFLIVAFHKACRDGAKDKCERVDAAIRLFEEMWPADCGRWKDRFKDDRK